MDPNALEKWRRAARIAAAVRDHVAARAQPGARLIDLAREGHRLMERMGGEPAFPLQISRNEIAAHYCSPPDDPTVLEEGDVVKIDCGVHVDGYVADTALTVDLSADGRHAGLLEAARAALEAAVEVARPRLEVREIGRVVEEAIRSRGFEPVRNLTGHGVGRWRVHLPPQIPNVPSGGGRLPREGCVAIEPFASTGRGLIEERGRPHVFMADRNLRKVRGADRDVLQTIRAFKGLPFGSRDLLDRHPYRKVAETLNALAASGQLVSYPPLCDVEGSWVAQFEHTLYVSEKGVEVLTAAPSGAAAGGEG